MSYDPRSALAWAASQIGTAEAPPGSNDVPYWPEWQKLTGQSYAGEGDAWCGAFLWLALHAGGWDAPANFVSVAAVEDWARSQGLWSDAADSAALGDAVVLYGRGVHVGFVVGYTAGGVVTVEGNAGDAVRRGWHPPDEVHGVARLSLLAAPAPAPKPTRKPQPATAPGASPTEVDVATLPTVYKGHGAPGTVRAVQRLASLTGSQVDGIFGPVTDQAVRNAQHAAGVTVDGVVGPITWARLLGVA